jgi:glutaredoxin-like protein NrdH
MSKDPKAVDHVRELGYTQAPVVAYEGKHWSGFRMDKLQTLFARIFSEGNTHRNVTKPLP